MNIKLTSGFCCHNFVQYIPKAVKTKKVIYKIVGVCFLLFVLGFDSCKDGCWRCYERNIFYTEKTCNEATANMLMNQGWTCWK
jgi:hypothetical protein